MKENKNNNFEQIQTVEDNEHDPALDPQDLSYFSFFKYLYKILLTNMVLTLLQNIQMFFVIMFLNSKYDSDKDMINSVGSVNSLLTIILYPLFYGNLMTIELRGANAFGGNKIKTFSNIIYRVRLIGLSLLFIMMVLILSLHNPLFRMLNYSDNQIKYAFCIICFKLVAIFFEFEFNIMIRLLMITGNGLQAIMIIVCSCGLNILYAFIYIKLLNIHIFSVGLTTLTTQITAVSIVWTYVYVLKPISHEIIKFRKVAFNYDKVFEQLKFVFVLSSLALLDSLDSETMSIIAGFLDKTSYSAYNILYSIYLILTCFSNSFYSTTNIIISISSGENNIQKLKTWFNYLLITGASVTLLALIVIFISSNMILNLLTNNYDLLNLSKKVFPLVITCLFLETTNNIFKNTLKGLGKFAIAILITIFTIGCNIVFIYFSSFIFENGLFGIFIGYFSYLSVSIIIGGIMLKLLDWNVCMDENNKSLNDSELTLNEENDHKLEIKED